MGPACANCLKPIAERSSKLQCDGCKKAIHLSCTELSSDDRITRHKIRGVSIVCNPRSQNLGSVAELKEILLNFKTDIQRQIDDLNNKLVELNDKISTVESFNTVEFVDSTANEALERINRSRNVLIRGVPEVEGDIPSCKDHDLAKIKEILHTVSSQSIPVSFHRIGRANQRFSRMIKVIMASESEAKFILKNKSKVLENRATKNVSIIDDKTPVQQERLKELRKELESRKNNGEEDITIKYIQGVPKITKFRKQNK